MSRRFRIVWRSCLSRWVAALLVIAATGCEQGQEVSEDHSSAKAENVGATAKDPGNRAAADAPSLVFTDSSVDLGEVRDRFQHRFRFQNRGANRVEITALQPSCNCTAVDASSRALLPGEEGEVVVDIDLAKRQPGPEEYIILVEYKDPVAQHARLRIRAYNSPSLTVIPSSLSLASYGRNPAAARVRILGYREVPLVIERIESSAGWLKSRILEQSEDYLNGWACELEVYVAGDSVPAGKNAEAITLYTNDKEKPVVAVPVEVAKLPRLFLPVSHVFPRRSAATGRWTVQFTLCDRGGMEVVVDAVDCTSAGKRCSVRKTSSRASPLGAVEVELDELDLQNLEWPLSLEIHISEPCEEKLNVAVFKPVD